MSIDESAYEEETEYGRKREARKTYNKAVASYRKSTERKPVLDRGEALDYGSALFSTFGKGFQKKSPNAFRKGKSMGGKSSFPTRRRGKAVGRFVAGINIRRLQS